MITFLILNFSRPNNLSRIIDSLKSQSIPVKVFVWDNSNQLENCNADLIVQSSKNVMSYPIPFMLSLADTEFVGKIDDDLCPSDDQVVERLLNCLVSEKTRQKFLVGTNGVVVGQSYINSQKVDFPTRDVDVDIVKGRCFVTRKKWIAELNNVFDYVGRHVDLKISLDFSLNRRKHHIVCGGLKGRFQELPTGKISHSGRSNHYQERNQVIKMHFLK
jgi:hypothetical protein